MVVTPRLTAVRIMYTAARFDFPLCITMASFIDLLICNKSYNVILDPRRVVNRPTAWLGLSYFHAPLNCLIIKVKLK
jgi:hypothetical protein